jgi:hypothetical protein
VKHDPYSYDDLRDLDLALEVIEPWWAICRERKGWKYDWFYGEAFTLLDRAMDDIIKAEKLMKDLQAEKDATKGTL